jgi:hypothetical protein
MFNIIKLIRERIRRYFFIKKYKKRAKYWREHPVEFCEEFFGCKLYPYQKDMINKINKINQDRYKR